MRKNRLVILAVAAAIVAMAACVFIFRGAIFNKIVETVVLKAGEPIKFGNYTVLIDKIEGDKLIGIKISGKNRKLEAQSGDYAYLANENAIKFNLINGVAEDVDPNDPEQLRRLTFKQMLMKIRLKNPPKR